MAIILAAHECPAELSQQVSHHWEEKQKEIEPLVQSWPKEQRRVHLNFSCRDNGFTASAVLGLPTATLIGRTDQAYAEPGAAIDYVARVLMEKVIQHKHSLANEQAQQRPHHLPGA